MSSIQQRLDNVELRMQKLERQHARAIDASHSPYLRTLSTGGRALDHQLKEWLEVYLHRRRGLEYERDVLKAALSGVHA